MQLQPPLLRPKQLKRPPPRQPQKPLQRQLPQLLLLNLPLQPQHQLQPKKSQTRQLLLQPNSNNPSQKLPHEEKAKVKSNRTVK